MLRRLYLGQRLTIAALGKRYHTAPKVARRWLRDAGIPIQPRTSRDHRTTLDTTQLRELYHDREWTAAEIAPRLDTTTHLVLRALHDAGIPVRRGSRRRRRPEEDTRLLAELYTDAEITAALDQHQVPRRPEPGSITSRFPTAVPLTEELLHDLYTGIGLSARQIELLTGQPHEQILDALHRAGITVRRQAAPPPGWPAAEPDAIPIGGANMAYRAGAADRGGHSSGRSSQHTRGRLPSLGQRRTLRAAGPRRRPGATVARGECAGQRAAS